jgi:hypothetical protein
MVQIKSNQGELTVEIRGSTTQVLSELTLAIIESLNEIGTTPEQKQLINKVFLEMLQETLNKD